MPQTDMGEVAVDLWIASAGKTKHPARVSAIMALAVIGGFILAAGVLTINARGATATVTVTWVIPVDKTIAISYPTGLTASRFSPASSTFTQLAADSQTDATASWRVTNNGNTAVALTAVFNGAVPSGVTQYRIATASSGGAPSGNNYWWTNANATTSQSIHGGTLAAAASWDYFAWSWGTQVVSGTTSDVLTVTSA